MAPAAGRTGRRHHLPGATDGERLALAVDNRRAQRGPIPCLPMDGAFRSTPPGERRELSTCRLVSSSSSPACSAGPGAGMGWDPPCGHLPGPRDLRPLGPGRLDLFRATSRGSSARRGPSCADRARRLPRPPPAWPPGTGVPVSSVSEHLGGAARDRPVAPTTRTGRSLTHQRTTLGATLTGATLTSAKPVRHTTGS